MSLLISIEDLLNANKVESNRIEYKASWNPKPIMRSICAFANDFEHLGSGYIIIGVEEEEGIAQRPVKGVLLNQIDRIQRELFQHCRLLKPQYMPRISVEEIDGKHLLVIWVPAGTFRPYEVPDDVTARLKNYNFRIRWGGNTIIPTEDQKRELLSLTAQVPFDDRVNQFHSIEELDFGLMREHLYKTKSRLFKESAKMDTIELAEKMNLSQGSAEHLFPKNVGLLMFTQDPTKYFRSAHIDIVEFPDGLGGDVLSENIFKGPIQKQLADALDYLKNNVVKSKTIKHANQAETTTVHNYAYGVLEEALPNAVYHRSYEQHEAIEVRVLSKSIEIISYSGTDPSLKQSDFDQRKVRNRRYRNPRIGEFLKELELTEGRGTGIPRMETATNLNDSPKVIFDIDEPHHTSFITEIPIHPAFLETTETVKEQKSKIEKIVGYELLTPRQKDVLVLIVENNKITYDEMASALEVKSTTAIQKHINGLKKAGSISRDKDFGGEWRIHFEK